MFILIQSYSGDNMINIQFVTVSLKKVKKRLRFRGGGWGGSEGRKIMSTGLLLPKVLRKKGGGGCIYLGQVQLNGGIR